MPFSFQKLLEKEIIINTIEVVEVVKCVMAKILHTKTTSVISSVFAPSVCIKKFSINAKIRNSYTITTTYSIKKLIRHITTFIALYDV